MLGMFPAPGRNANKRKIPSFSKARDNPLRFKQPALVRHPLYPYRASPRAKLYIFELQAIADLDCITYLRPRWRFARYNDVVGTGVGRRM